MSSVNCHLVRNLLNNLTTRYSGHRKVRVSPISTPHSNQPPSKRRALNRNDTPSPSLLKPSPTRRIQRPLTAYQYFIKFHFNQAKSFGPSVNPFAVASDEWRALSDEEKFGYSEKAKEWNAQNALVLQKITKHRCQEKKEDEEGKQPRARRIVTAYDMFLETKGNAILQKAPPTIAPEIVLTNVWRTFGPEDKLQYEILAKEKTHLLKLASRKVVIGYDIFFACLYPTLRELEPKSHHLMLMNQVTRHWDRNSPNEKIMFRTASEKIKSSIIERIYKSNNRSNRLLSDPDYMPYLMSLPFRQPEPNETDLNLYEDEKKLLQIEGVYQYCQKRLWVRNKQMLSEATEKASQNFNKYHPTDAWWSLSIQKRKDWTMFQVVTGKLDDLFINFLSFMYTHRRRIEGMYPSFSLLQKYVILDHLWRTMHPLPQPDATSTPLNNENNPDESGEGQNTETGSLCKYENFVDRLQYRLIVPRHHSYTNSFVAFYSEWAKKNEHVGKNNNRHALSVASEAWRKLSDEEREKYKQFGIEKTKENKKRREDKVNEVLMQMTEDEGRQNQSDQVPATIAMSVLSYPFSVFRCFLHLELLKSVNRGRCVDAFGKHVESVERQWQEAKESLLQQDILPFK